MLLKSINCCQLQRKSKSSKQNDFILSFSLSHIVTNLGSKAEYIYPRSSHWSKTLFTPSLFHEITFYDSFRMSRKSFNKLHDFLQPYIEKQTTNFRQPVASPNRLAIFLYHASLGVPYQAISNQFGLGKSTISTIIHDVANAIVIHLSKQLIRFPTTDEALRTMDFWRETSAKLQITA
jgi:hypothetical protein